MTDQDAPRAASTVAIASNRALANDHAIGIASGDSMHRWSRPTATDAAPKGRPHRTPSYRPRRYWRSVDERSPFRVCGSVIRIQGVGTCSRGS